MAVNNPAFLRNLRIRKVALVKRGANPEAEIVFFKSYDEGAKCSECRAYLDGSKVCPECGHPLAERTEKSAVVDDEKANEVANRLHERAEELASLKGVTISKGYSLVYGDPEGQKLLSEYKAAQGDAEASDLYKSAAQWGS